MSKYKLLLPVIILCGVAFGVWAASAKVMNVRVKEADLGASPSKLAKSVAVVRYGDPVTVIETRGSWKKVSIGDGSTVGWIHESAITKDKLDLKAGTQDVASKASSGDLALATKGFNSKVEADFKSKHGDMDFKWVDKMIGFKSTPDEMRAFLAAGQVSPPTGGAK
jgi:hypothetical protein